MAGSEQPGRKIRTWLTGRFGEMRLAEMGTLGPLAVSDVNQESTQNCCAATCSYAINHQSLAAFVFL